MSPLSDLKLLGFKRDPKKDIHESFKFQRSYIMISKKVWDPNTDIYETPQAIVLKLEVAGLKSDDIEIISQENKLIIKGDRKDRSPSNKQRYHQMQIDYGEFEKVFVFPFIVNSDEIKAVFSDGFLEINIPKHKKKDREEIIIKIES